MNKELPLNIEAFNSVVSQVLAKLYNAFPNEIDLEPIRIAHDASVALGSDNTELLDRLYKVAEDAIAFLIEEGFIRTNAKYTSLDFTGFPGVRLTLKGFAILGGAPSALESKETLGSQISDAVSKGATSSLSELVSKALIGAVQLGLGAVGVSG